MRNPGQNASRPPDRMNKINCTLNFIAPCFILIARQQQEMEMHAELDAYRYCPHELSSWWSGTVAGMAV
jgi:hypothetical protein